MIKNKETFLKEIALLPEMKNNIISIVFAQHQDIDISKKDKFYDNVINYHKRYKESDRANIDLKQEEDKSLDEWRDKDLRIKDIKLKSVRYYPDSAKPFGIDFSDQNGKPKSMVILGANGSGKSSLFNAMEYAYCNNIGEAELRNYKDKKDYLSHLDNGFKMSDCVVETLYKSFTIQQENIPQSVRKMINPDTHFISEYDIIEKGQLDYERGIDDNFHKLIAQSLGLTELLEFEKNITLFNSYKRLTESKRISEIEKNIKTNVDFIDKNKVDLTEKQNQLQAIKENKKIIPEDSTLTRSIDIFSRIKQRNISFSFDVNQFIEIIDHYIITYDDYNFKKQKSSGLSEIQFLNLGLELLGDSDSCPFCDSSTKSVEEIEKDVRTRIEKIKELDQLLKRLNGLFDAANTKLRSLLNELKMIYGKINGELKIAKESSDFNDLFVSHQNFLTFMSDILNSDFILEVDGIDDNSGFLDDDKHFIKELLIRFDDFIKKQLPSAVDYIIKYIATSEEIIHNIEKNLLNKSSEKTPNEQIIELTADISRIKNQIADAEYNVKKYEADIIPLQETQSLFNNIQKEVNSYLPVIHGKLNSIVNEAFTSIKDVVENILNEFFRYDKRNVSLEILSQPEDVDSETGEILSSIIIAKIKSTDNSFRPQPVKKYFNAFHYKLFCTLVGISIAVVSRNNTGINMPLVMDDVFYASDFENRALIEKFLISIFQIFNKYSKGKDLQLIMFTHDQMIFESAMNASAYIKDEIIFAKLFPYYTAQDNGEYKELIYRLQSDLPSLIIKKAMLSL